MHVTKESGLFQKKNDASRSIKLIIAKQGNKLIRVFNARQGLIGEKRQTYVKSYVELMALTQEQFALYCQRLIEALVEYYQDLPETRNSYFSERGGLLEHALSRTEAALSLCRAYFVNDEKQQLSEVQQLWMYALFSAALLQGIGKLMIDFAVDSFDEQANYTTAWNPLLGSLYANGTYFCYEFASDAPDAYRKRLNILLARQVMPKEGFKWIASNSEVLAVWLALLNEDHRSAGTLGPILIRADALAIQRYFSEKNARDFAKDSNQSRYGRFANTFITPQVNDSQTGDSLAGIEFIKWLSSALGEAKLMINKAPLFMVPGGLLMSPEIFKLFIREHPQFKNWLAVQEGFLTMKLHASSVTGDVTQRFEQHKTQQVMSGVVLANYAAILPDKVTIVNPNNGASKALSVLDIINDEKKYTGFIRQKTQHSMSDLKTLNADGKWVSDQGKVNKSAPSSNKQSN